MTIEFTSWGHPGAALFECQMCKAVVPFQHYEDKLDKHAKKHNGIALIKGEGENK